MPIDGVFHASRIPPEARRTRLAERQSRAPGKQADLDQHFAPFDDPDIEIDTNDIEAALLEYAYNCGICHGGGGVPAGGAPDLRSSIAAAYLPSLTAVLRDGALEDRGMPKFDHLSDRQITRIHSAVRFIARRDLATMGE